MAMAAASKQWHPVREDLGHAEPSRADGERLRRTPRESLLESRHDRGDAASMGAARLTPVHPASTGIESRDGRRTIASSVDSTLWSSGQLATPVAMPAARPCSDTAAAMAGWTTCVGWGR